MPVLAKFNADLQLMTVEDLSKPPCNVEENGLIVNLAALEASELESFVAYYIQQLVLPVLHIETERLTIRRIMEHNLEDFFEIASCVEIGIKDGFRPYESLEKFKPAFTRFLSDKYRCTVELKAERKVIGIINFRENDTRAVTAFEIGYDVNKKYWRRGYAFEFLSAFLDFCLRELRVDLITAGCVDGNVASMNLLKKLGFTYEGKLRKALYHGIYGATDLNSFYIEKPENT